MTLECRVEASPVPDIQWKKDGKVSLWQGELTSTSSRDLVSSHSFVDENSTPEEEHISPPPVPLGWTGLVSIGLPRHVRLPYTDHVVQWRRAATPAYESRISGDKNYFAFRWYPDI